MYGPQDGKDSRQVVSITDVSPARMEATAISRYGPEVKISLKVLPSGLMFFPSRGEQWLVERSMGSYILVSKIAFQDERTLLDLKEGDTLLQGSRVSVVSERVLIDSGDVYTPSGRSLISPPLCSIQFTSDGSVHFSEKTGDATNWYSVHSDSILVRVPGVYDIRLNSQNEASFTVRSGGKTYTQAPAASVSRLIEARTSITLSTSVPTSGTVDLKLVSELSG